MRRLLPVSRDQLPTEILDSIDIDSYRVRQTGSDKLTPDPDTSVIEPMEDNEAYGSTADQLQTLSEIIEFLNEAFGDDAPEAEKIVNEVLEETVQDDGVSNAVRINPPDKARLAVNDVATQAFTRRHKTNFNIYKRFSDDEYVRNRILDWINDEVQRGLSHGA